MHSTYVLIDTTLLGDLQTKPWLQKNRRPSWIAAIYGRYAVDVSPVVVDVERAFQCSRISTLMNIVNARRPQLGVSFIETNLTLEKLVEHLRQFICVLTRGDVELTLRFADGVVLPNLAFILTPQQWSLITAPFISWKVHGRDGKLFSLPILNARGSIRPPLMLTGAQIRALKDSMGADQLLVNLRMYRSAPPSTYLTEEAFAYATQARRIWHVAGHSDDQDLVLFAAGVFDTDGRLLSVPGLEEALARSDRTKIREDLQRMVELNTTA